MQKLLKEITKLETQKNKVELMLQSVKEARKRGLSENQINQVLMHCEAQSVGFSAGFERCLEMINTGELGLTRENTNKSIESPKIAYIDSREVAVVIEKEHSHLLRDIKQYINYLGESKIGFTDFFIESSYLTTQNKSLPCYLITQKGCELIAHKMTGAKGVQFSAWYINKFHEMKDTLEGKKYYYQEQSIEECQKSKKENWIDISKGLTGKPKGMLTATEIGQQLGISKRRVGIIALKYNLKTNENGKWIKCISSLSDKPVETFVYYPQAVEAIKKHI